MKIIRRGRRILVNSTENSPPPPLFRENSPEAPRCLRPLLRRWTTSNAWPKNSMYTPICAPMRIPEILKTAPDRTALKLNSPKFPAWWRGSSRKLPLSPTNWWIHIWNPLNSNFTTAVWMSCGAPESMSSPPSKNGCSASSPTLCALRLKSTPHSITPT